MIAKDDCSIKCAITQNTSLALKGFFSILVIICHIRGEVDALNGTLIGKVVTQFGYLSVSIFFFLSGYGLWKRGKEDSNYLASFLKKRVLSLYIQYVLLIFFYATLFLVWNKKIEVTTFAQSFLFGKTVVPYGWYFQAITVFYLIFYLSCRFLNKKGQIVGIAVGLCLYALFCFSWKLTTTWYETSFAFLTGVVLAEYEGKVKYISLKQIIKGSFQLFILTVITIILGTNKSLGCVATLFKMISAVFFCLIVYYAAIVYSEFENNIVASSLRKLGTLSLEVYAFQGVVILFVLIPLVDSLNPAIIFSLGIGLVICCAIIVHPAFEKIRKILLRLRCSR